MCGVTSVTNSPSVRSTTRNTPCVLGCCGPMLMSISSVRTSNSTVSGWIRSVGIGLFQRDSVVLVRHLVIFPQRMAFPIFRAKDAAQIGMADEQYAHQVEDLALVPLGRAPHVADGGNLGQCARRRLPATAASAPSAPADAGASCSKGDRSIRGAAANRLAPLSSRPARSNRPP